MNTPYACWNTTFTTCGIYEIRVAPSNTNIAYMMLNGYVYKTANLKSRSPTWSATGFARDTTSNPNDVYAQFGPKIAIDPANADIVIVCTESAGCFKTINGGMSFSAITGVTNATSVGMLVVFDPSSSVTGGATQGIYISSYGTGVYHSTNGGSSWTLTANTPTTHSFMTCTLAGVLYFVANSGGSDQTLHIFSRGSWSSVTVGTNGNPIAGVAVDPANFNIVVAVNNAGQLTYSTDAASSFGGYVSQANTSRIATDVPWLGWTNENYMTAGQIIFDPAQSNVLFFAEGIGVWTTIMSAHISPGGKNAYTSQSRGIEQLVGQDIISPWGCTPSCNPVTLEGDRPTFYVSDPDTYPSTHGAASPQAHAIVWGHGINWATGTPSTLVIDGVQQGDGSGTSSDGGQTWTTFGGYPVDYHSRHIGGGIAASSSRVFIWALSNDGQLSETTDGGSTWVTPLIDGVSATAPFGWDHVFFSDRRIVTSDRVNSNTFYAYNGACNRSNSTAGIYRGVYSTGWTWTIARSGHFDAGDCGASILKGVPGNAGEMYYTSGIQNPGPYPHNYSFYDCQDTNGTITCRPVSKVKEVWAFGFGAAKSEGNGYPTIYIAGWVSQDSGKTYKFGIWRSTDHASTWTNLGIPLNSLDVIRAVEGDANIYGRVYVAFGGSGFAYGQFN